MLHPTPMDIGPGVFEDGDRPLVGGKAIQCAIRELLGVELSVSAVFKQLASGAIPANKTAGTWITSERKLRLHYARTTNARASPPANKTATTILPATASDTFKRLPPRRL